MFLLSVNGLQLLREIIERKIKIKIVCCFFLFKPAENTLPGAGSRRQSGTLYRTFMRTFLNYLNKSRLVTNYI